MRVLVLGAGMMGSAAAADLARSPGVERVILADADLKRARRAAAANSKIHPAHVDVRDGRAVQLLMRSVQGVLSAVPYYHNLELTRCAIRAGAHFCDLGGNSLLVQRQFQLHGDARRAGVAVLPDCGLSPGLTSILVADGLARLGSVEAVRIRAGGLPLEPIPPLNYKLVFSAYGLLNQYLEPARILRNGKYVEVEPLTGLETIRFAGFPPLEAFHASGGASTLPESFAGKIRDLDEKTIRYPGHAEAFRLLFWLGFGEAGRREALTQALEEKLRLPGGDVVLLRVDLAGKAGGLRYQMIEYGTEELTAMMKTTAWPASILLQMLINASIPGRGLLRLEHAVHPRHFLHELARRGIEIRLKRLPALGKKRRSTQA
jgi:lysine 6-dehydrogenase